MAVLPLAGLPLHLAIGALGGLSLSAHRSRPTRLLAGLGGAAVLAGSETVARRRQRPNEIPALPHRILASAAMAAPLGWLAGRFTGPVAIGSGAGTVCGLFGFRPQKVALGPVLGAAMCRIAGAALPAGAL